MIFYFFNYCISLSALIENKIFSVHGGLSPAISTLDQVKEVILLFGNCCEALYWWY